LAKNWVKQQHGQKMTRRFFDDTTVETAMRSSIDYNYTTINNFEDSLAKARKYCHDNDDKDNDSLAKARRPHYADASFDVVMILDSSLTPRHGVAFDNNVKRLARPEKGHTNV
jgi:hypothetical protein